MFLKVICNFSCRATAPNHFTGATAVATTVPEAGTTELEFVLDQPFEYTGGNLLVETLVTEVGQYGSTYFLGVKTDYNPSFYHYYWWWSNDYMVDFLPKATFTYEIGDTPEPPTPTEKTIAPLASMRSPMATTRQLLAFATSTFRVRRCVNPVA